MSIPKSWRILRDHSAYCFRTVNDLGIGLDAKPYLAGSGCFRVIVVQQAVARSDRRNENPNMIEPSLSPDDLAPIVARLKPVNAELARRYPGESGARQPVHTV